MHFFALCAVPKKRRGQRGRDNVGEGNEPFRAYVNCVNRLPL